MKVDGRRRYSSPVRDQAADATKARVLKAAKDMFTRSGIDRVTISKIAIRANVSVPTVYALYKSKEGILRALMTTALFGPAFQAAHAALSGVTDPIRLITLTAEVARRIYEGESTDLGLMRGLSAFSPALRKIEQEFETLRLEMQEDRIDRLFADAKANPDLSKEEARRILWMYTSRDIYRMLVQEGGWTPDQYQEWLARTLVTNLVAVAPSRQRPRGR
ncbi:MAG TPA: TetR/AcrR family transcriptional regulator [Usitatibacter sp.]|jgi:AcrR family transcriptional regulator|nr:TetR/AcrR family transcriptional regulator [Usitatibacter sp.]